jgi:pyrimidine-nucleoside phosphorylase
MINIFTLIEKKKHKQELTKQEIDYFVDNYVKTNTIHDYQASALLMAICLNGLSRKETFFLTDAYVRSGKTYDYKKYLSPVIDKHSLGGVGDKVSLIFAPIICALGIGVAKISGKGLG